MVLSPPLAGKMARQYFWQVGFVRAAGTSGPASGSGKWGWQVARTLAGKWEKGTFCQCSVLSCYVMLGAIGLRRKLHGRYVHVCSQ